MVISVNKFHKKKTVNGNKKKISIKCKIGSPKMAI
jgi:hypothetical protein